MSADDAVSVSARPTGINDEQAAAALARVEAGAARAGDLQSLLAHGSALVLGERFEDGAQLYRTLAARFEDRPRLLAGLARCEAALGDGDAARDALEKARKAGLPSEVVSQIAALIPGEGRDWATLRAEAEAAIAAGATDAPAFNALARACFGVGDGRAAVEAVERALGAGGAEAEVLERAARLCDALNEIDRALSLFGELMRLQPSRPRWVLNSARVLQRAGRATEAELMLETLYRNDVPSDAALRRPLIQDDPKRELQIVRGSSDAAVLVFMGLADQLVMPIPMFDRYLAEHDFTAVYLRDHQRLLYLNGMPTLAPDYAGTLAKLRGMLDAFGVRRLITLGNSAGGVGAIAYGVDMGAEQIIGFGSPTTLVGKLKSVDHRARAFADRLYRSVPLEQRDIESKLRDPGRKARVDLFYGEGMVEDRAHAMQLEGVHGVTLRPLEGFGGHGALLRLAQEGRLRCILSELFAR